MEQLIIILLFIIFVICFMLLLLCDYFVIKTRLKNCRPVIGKIVYFDEVQFFRSGYHVSIVEYMSGEITKNAIILKSNKDKIGDEIEIVTDGDLAVRKKIVIKQDNNWGAFLVVFLVLFLGRDNLVTGAEQFIIISQLVIICILMVVMFIYPSLHEIFDREVKKGLGWRR